MKKLLSLILALSMTVMMLVGCQSGGSTEHTQNPHTQNSAVASPRLLKPYWL